MVVRAKQARAEPAGYAGSGASRESLGTLPVPPPGRWPGSFDHETWQPLTRLAALGDLSPLRGARWFQVRVPITIYGYFPVLAILLQPSLSGTVRLNTGAPGLESTTSAQK